MGAWEIGWRKGGDWVESSPQGATGCDSLNQLAVSNNQDPSDQHVRNPFGILGRVVEGGAIDYPVRVKHGDVGIGSDLQPAFGLDAEPLGRHQVHFADCVH